jgi:para-aminobenzoate synthetase component 1
MNKSRKPFAYFGGLLATDLVEIADLTHDQQALDRGGWWAVLAAYEGRITGYRFDNVRRRELPGPSGRWHGPAARDWRSSMDETQYLSGVQRIREHIEAGDVYQVNLCRMLTAPLPGEADPLALARLLAAGNPSPHQGVLRLPDEWVVTASPELFLHREGDVISSSPIKGTTRPAEPFADKDFPENIMITDLVRNDLGRIGRPGSVTVTELLARQEHPGLAHLVSTVRATLAHGVGWPEILSATFPPGSVTGAPKIRAQQVISELETTPRGPYCGAIGFIDADNRKATLAVGIRTFFTSDASRLLNFGTGAGITYSSDPPAEWAETELKAARLISLASGQGSMTDPAR